MAHCDKAEPAYDFVRVAQEELAQNELIAFDDADADQKGQCSGAAGEAGGFDVQKRKPG